MAELFRTYEVPVEERDRLPFAAPIRIEPADIPAGPRDLPKWAIGAMINWRWAYSNNPEFLVRCAFDPLAFAHDGSPVWRMFEYADDRSDAGAKRIGRKPAGRGWIAKQDGVASCHYHSGTIRMVEFEENVTDDTGKIVWLEAPDWSAGKAGIPQTHKYAMLATDQQQGYAGSVFTITLAAQTLPVWCDAQRKTIDTPVEAGTKLKLRGPWHGGAPDGYVETSYQYDKESYVPPKRRAWHRKWYERLGYFGLYIKPDILLDILTTFEPHVPWAVGTEVWRGREERRLIPLNPVTGLPKGWNVYPDQCPEHDYVLSPWATGRDRAHPNDRCKHCGQQRNPGWRYVSPVTGKPVESAGGKDPIYFDLYLEPPAARAAARTWSWPEEVKVPLPQMRGPVTELAGTEADHG